MGYSVRYHAASLVAVFVALAAGIVIGAGLGGDLVNEAADDIERSLERDLDDAQAEIDRLEERLAIEVGFADEVYPAIVRGRLANSRIAFVSLGELNPDLGAAVDESLEHTAVEAHAGGASRITVVDLEPDLGEVTDALRGTRFAQEITETTPTASLGDFLGRSLVTGGRPLELIRDVVFTSSTGDFRSADGVIVYLGSTPSGETEQTYVDAIMDGLRSRAEVPVVGVELSAESPSAIPFYTAHSASSVDSLDRVPGKVALVFTLLGQAQGNFGIKPTADRLIPELSIADEPAGGDEPGGNGGGRGSGGASNGDGDAANGPGGGSG